MRYVIIRDDDTNALTPIWCLERLYRPFLDRGLPVNLATIPQVATGALQLDGRPEGFLLGRNGENRRTVPLAANSKLTHYLLENEGFHIVQHGCHHELMEFDQPDPTEIARRLDLGRRQLLEAGLPKAQTFVAPYDRLSRPGFQAVAERFHVLSTGWFEWRRLPSLWWPRYALRKLRHAPHWRVGQTLLLSHPGCLLSCQRAYSTMLGGILHFLNTQRITVLVTHWWEYFRNPEPDEAFIDFLHETAAYLATARDLEVITFADLYQRNLPLN